MTKTKTNKTESSVYDVLLKVQNSFGVTKSNKAKNYSYRSASDILKYMPELRETFGFVLLQEESLLQIGESIVCKSIVTFKSLAHEEVVTTVGLAVIDVGSKIMSPQQTTRAGFSFALKGALENMFSLTEREDLKYEEESNKREAVASKLSSLSDKDYLFKNGEFAGRRLSSIQSHHELTKLKQTFEDKGHLLPNDIKQKLSDHLKANLKGVTI